MRDTKGIGRVEEWRGGLGVVLRVVRPFRLPVPEYLTMPRLHLPLIEPDVRISRIRLSDKTSCLRPQLAMPHHAQLFQAQLLVQVLVGKTLVDPNPHPVLVA